jgi:hypothetical protein
VITKDGYAAIPWYGKKYVILYNGQQIADVASAEKAVAYIRNEQSKARKEAKNKKGTS